MSGADDTGDGDADDGGHVHAAYAHCLRIAGGHYENFPVASHALPAALRAPVAAVYAFARTADDYADEGEIEAGTRLALLAEYGRRVDAIERGESVDDPVFIALADLHRRRALPLQPLRDLLRAFSQDVTRRRYRDEADLLAYCRCSADPVGRLLLHLFGHTSERDIAQSDAVCTALQLINFLQDIEQDYHENDRIYIPADEMARHGVSEDHFSARRTDAAMLALIAGQCARARRLLDGGAPLAWRLPGRIGLELRMVIFAAGRILDRVAEERADVFRRPRLRRSDWPGILWQAATARNPALDAG
jgi:squalene synthase HpnC